VVTDKEILKVGVIGLGIRSDLADLAHKPQKGVKLVAAADVRPEALGEFKKKYGADVLVSENYRDLLQDDLVDVVMVLSPDYLHEEHAVASLQAGKAVYLEKPMAITINACDRILRTAVECKGKLYLGHNMRHMTFVLKMKEIIDSGAIGEVKAGWCRHFISYGGDAYFKDWHAERSKATGLLLQKAAHDIDILHWLCGGYSKRVNAMGALTLYGQVEDRHAPDELVDVRWYNENWPPLSQKGLNPVIDVEDLSMMQMELDNGVFACYQQCHYTPDSWRNYTIIGTGGRVENFGDDPGNCVVRVFNRRSFYNPYGDEQYYIPPVAGNHGGADPSILAEFFRYVRQGGRTATSPVAARNSVAAGCVATDSLRNGGVPVEVPPLDPDIVAYFEDKHGQ
jgi:predicted dehydrogenase